MGFWGCVIFLVIIWIINKYPEWKYNNSVCPPGKKIDYDRANHDLVNGLSKREYYKRHNSGYYDIDK